MGIPGRIKRGVVVLEGKCTLPDGTPVTVVPRKRPATHIAKRRQRVVLPLVKAKNPGSLKLTNDRVATLLEEDDLAARR